MNLGPTRVTVELRPLDRDNTPTDSLARRPSRTKRYLPKVLVTADIEWSDHRSRISEGMSGANKQTRGIMLLPVRNGRRAGYTPDEGDLILATIARDGVRTSYESDRLFIRRATPVIPGVGGFRAWECTLADERAGR